MNIDFIKQCRGFSITLLSIAGGMLTAQGIIFFIWVSSLGYQWPPPFLGIVLTNFVFALGYIVIWHLFPRKWRNVQEFYSKLKLFVLALFLNQNTSLVYSFMVKTFLECPEEYQWILAITSTIAREIFILITKKLAMKCSNGDTRRTIIVCEHLTNSRHAIFLSTVLGSIATNTTSIIILAIDFIINIIITTKIVLYSKFRKNVDAKTKVELLQDLAINEIVEVIVPLTYLLIFLSAYYGPNAKLIGNIQNDYWQYEKIENIDALVKNISLFVCVDIISGALCYLILFVSCRFNLIQIAATVLREFGLVFTINTTYLFYLVNFMHLCILI